MSITRVQASTVGTSTGSGTVAASWPSPTTAGNFLYAALFHSGNPSTYTPPSGWTQVGSTANNGGGAPFVSIWNAVNAASQSGSQSWSFTSGTINQALLIEYSGIATSNPQDSSNQPSNAGSGNPATGSLTTVNAADLLLAAVLQVSTTGSGTYSSPTNSFAIVAQNVVTSGIQHNAVCVLERIVAATGTYSSTVTDSVNNGGYTTILAAFEAAGGGTTNRVLRPQVITFAPPPGYFD